MKKFYLFAAAAVLLTACVKTQNLDEVAPINTDETAVSFDVYTARATKAGKPQEITTAVLKEGPGFGVFAYYTDNAKYDPYVKPNFMYNQQVKWNAESKVWAYEPVKYWPNETGDAAITDDTDYVTFFAYAPYVISVPSSGAVKVPEGKGLDETEEQHRNITGMITNNTMGDPMIKYVVDWNPKTSVDLLWGVQPENEDPIVGKYAGFPFLDQLKPRTTNPKELEFKLMHALAKLNVQIDADVDANNHDQKVDSLTRIYVRSVTFEGFASKGALNLNNTVKDTPLWMDYNGIDNLVGEPVTIFDGRKDGKEGHRDGVATREKVLGLNPEIIQSAPYKTLELTDGVTNNAVNLFQPIVVPNDPAVAISKVDPVFVIPNGEEMAITIEYDVETIDENLAGYLSDGVTHGSSIKNTITKFILDSNDAKVKMVAGKAYTITLHLGMTSVKVRAVVNEWDEPAEFEVALPANE
jgi:hypothetical protein